MVQRVGEGLGFRDRYPFSWLYAVGFVAVAFTASLASFSMGRVALALGVAAAVAIAVPAKYAIGLAVVAPIFSFVLVPVIALQGVTLAVPAAVLGLAVLAIIKRWRYIQAPRHLGTVVLFFGLLVVSTALFSRDNSPLWIAMLLFLAAIPTFFLASNLSDTELRIISISVFILLGTQMVLAFAEATGLIDAVYKIAVDIGHGPKVAQKNTIVGDWYRATGTMLHALPLGFLAVTAAGLTTVTRPTFRWSWKTRVLVFAMASAACVFASARSSLIVLALLAVLTFPAGKRIAKFLQSALVCVGVAALLFSNGFFESRQVVELLSSGSVVHRLGVVSMLPLLDREPVLNLLIGSGRDAGNLLEHLLPNDGWLAVDNQFISTILMTGLFGLILLITVLLAGWRNAPRWRPVFLAQIAMFAIFDVFLWQSSLVLFMVVLGAMLSQKDAQPAKTTESMDYTVGELPARPMRF